MPNIQLAPLDRERLPELLTNYITKYGITSGIRLVAVGKGQSQPVVRLELALGCVLLGVGPDVCWVDHVNGTRLDNRRENLRPASPLQNAWNRGKAVNRASQY